MKIKLIGDGFSVCKLIDIHSAYPLSQYSFLSVTDEEMSLVCPTERAPTDFLAREDGWSMLRIEGQLDFSLVGVLAELSKTLAEENIGIFAVSTYNTDYILTRTSQFPEAVTALHAAGYDIIGE